VREQILPEVFWNGYKTLDITSFARTASRVSAKSKPLQETPVRTENNIQ